MEGDGRTRPTCIGTVFSFFLLILIIIYTQKKFYDLYSYQDTTHQSSVKKEGIEDERITLSQANIKFAFAVTSSSYAMEDPSIYDERSFTIKANY